MDGLILLGAYLYGEYPSADTLTVYGSLNQSVEDKIDYTEPVSYTHLDVYKRQVYVMFAAGFVGFLCKRCEVPLGPFVLALLLGNLCASNFRRAPVSYTHLSGTPTCGVWVFLCTTLPASWWPG